MKIKLFLFFFFLLLPVGVYADTAHSTVVMDIQSGRILYSKNRSEKQLIASTTKIMTCIVILENEDLNRKMVVGEEVLTMYGTNIYIEVGEELMVKDLLYGLMLRSGNDAAITLAVQSFGEEKFVEMMNEKAQELGMKNTTFQNPHGLDEKTKNTSTAYDMALLSRYAFQNPTYREIIFTKKYVTKSNKKSYVWYNRMSLLNQYEYCVGGKNGYTPRAGKSLVSYAKKGDMILTIVSLDDDSIYENHRNLYENFFSNYSLYTILNPNTFQVESTFSNHSYYIKNSFQYPLMEEEKDHIQTLLKISSSTEGEQVGDIVVYLDKEVIGKIPIYQKKETKKEEKSFFQKLKNLFVGYSKKINRRSAE